MPMVGAAVAVLMHGAAEFGNHDHDGIAVCWPERLSEMREAFAERLQMSRELARRAALIDVRVPSAEREESDADAGVAANQLREPVGIVAEAIRTGRAAVRLLHILLEIRHQMRTGLAPFPVGFAKRVAAVIHSIERDLDDRPIERQRARGRASQ